MRPLADLKILDLSRLLPGPYLTRVLTDLGADVIKIESPDGDPTRYLPPFLPDDAACPGMGAAFAALNFGKRSVVLDLKASLGIDVFMAMLQRADVVVESFRPGVMDRLGLSYAALAAANPGIILCSVSGYGQTGALAQTPGHDLNYVARAGVLSMFGPPGLPPVVPGVQLADVLGGSMSAAVGILAALLERHKTGRGQHLDVSMTRSAMALLTMEWARRSLGVREPRGAGILTGGLPCYRVYETADGRYMALAALEPKFFAAFCARAGCAHLETDGLASGEAGAAVMVELEGLFRTRTQAAWVELMRGSDSCCEPVQTPEEAMLDGAIDAPLASFGSLQVLISDVGMRFATDASASRPLSLPGLGEHSLAVARELGVDGALVAQAAAVGALRPSA